MKIGMRKFWYPAMRTRRFRPIQFLVILRWKWLIALIIQAAILSAIINLTNFRNPMFFYVMGCLGLLFAEMQRIKNKSAR
jgi:hypothetical protein